MSKKGRSDTRGAEKMKRAFYKREEKLRKKQKAKEQNERKQPTVPERTRAG